MPNFIRKLFISLKHENFRLFFGGQSISLIGTWVQQTALSWLIYDITGSKLLLGLVAALGSLPMLLLSAFGGAIADKYPKRKILIFTQTSAMINAFILAFLVFFNLIQVWHIMIIAAISGIILSVDMPVRQAFYIDIVGKDDLMNAIALNSSIVNLARIVGPAIAGIIMLKCGVAWRFILNALSFIAVLYALFKLKLLSTGIKKKTESILEYTISGFTYVKNNKQIFNLMILMLVMGIFGSSCSILMPAIAKDIFSLGEKGYSLLLSANGAGALLGALSVAYAGNTQKKENMLMLVSIWSVYPLFYLHFAKFSGLGLFFLCV